MVFHNSFQSKSELCISLLCLLLFLLQGIIASVADSVAPNLKWLQRQMHSSRNPHPLSTPTFIPDALVVSRTQTPRVLQHPQGSLHGTWQPESDAMRGHRGTRHWGFSKGENSEGGNGEKTASRVLEQMELGDMELPRIRTSPSASEASAVLVHPDDADTLAEVLSAWTAPLLEQTWVPANPCATWHGITCNPGTSRVTSLNVPQLGVTGQLSTALGRLRELQRLNLFANNLRGSIPQELSALSSLTFMSLSRNQLSGPIPSSVSSLASLEYLGLFMNKLSGPIPPQLSNLKNLTGLVLADNQLNGSLPASLGSLPKLQAMYLSGNQLSGPIPRSFSKTTALSVMNLSGNELSGGIPTRMGALIRRRQLGLFRSRFTGSIPPQLPSGASLQPRTVNCARYGYSTYTLKRGDTCLTLLRNKRLNFKSMRQIEDINRPISGFRCLRAVRGLVICHPKA